MVAASKGSGFVVDFWSARRQVERQCQFPAAVRRAAFAIYVGLSELADDGGGLELPAERIHELLDVTRVAWDRYRNVLVAAGLLTVGPRRGRHPRAMHVLAPTRR